MAKKRKILFFIYPIIVVYSRIYLGVHYPSDIIGGALLGLIFGTIVFKLIERHFLKLSHDKT
jgi:undecaprenyl-diphosphatase